MTWLLEDSLTPLIVGSFLTAAAAFAWLQTGYRILLHAAGLFLVVTAAFVALERFVETDREQIAKTLDLIVRDIVNNDLEAILNWVHPSDLETRKRAEAEFPRYDFKHVDIKNNLEVEIKRSDPPKEATATFNVVVVASDRNGILRDGRAPFSVELELKQVGDQWKVADYRYDNPNVGLLRKKEREDES
jgi:hypothetical protein